MPKNKTKVTPVKQLALVTRSSTGDPTTFPIIGLNSQRLIEVKQQIQEAMGRIETLIIGGALPNDTEVVKAELELNDLRIQASVLSGVRLFCLIEEQVYV